MTAVRRRFAARLLVSTVALLLTLGVAASAVTAQAASPDWRPDLQTETLWELLEQPCLAVSASSVRTGTGASRLQVAWPLVLPVLEAIRNDPTLAMDAASLRARLDEQVRIGQGYEPEVATQVLQQLFESADQGTVAYAHDDWSNPALILLSRVLGSAEQRDAWTFAAQAGGQSVSIQRLLQRRQTPGAIRASCSPRLIVPTTMQLSRRSALRTRRLPSGGPLADRAGEPGQRFTGRAPW